MDKIKKAFFPWVVLAAASILYLLSLHAYYVGGFNDDAFYILAARALLQGRYVELSTPGAPPLINYLPGYPLLLAPVIAVVGDRFVWYQLYSILIVLLTLLLLWRVLEDEPLSVRAPTVVLSAFNPLTVSTSGVVLSDIPFFLWSILLFKLLRENWESDSNARWALISLVAIFAYYTRIIGAALCAAIVLVLIFERRWKRAMACAGLMLALFLPFYLRNVLARGIGSWYVAEFSDLYTKDSLVHRTGELVFWQLPFYLHASFVTYLFRWPVFFPPSFGFLTVTLGLVVMATGFLKWGRRPAGAVMLIYLALTLAVLLTWHRQSTRYLLPVLPFVYLFFFRGLRFIDDRGRLSFSTGWIGMTLALLLFIKPTQNIIHTSLHVENAVNTPPGKTFSWIKSHTQTEDVFAAELDAQLYLLTQRKTFHFRKDLAPLDFYQWARAEGIGYLLVAPTDLILATKDKNTVHDPLSVDALRSILVPGRFEEVFESPEEKTQIWKVLKSGPPLV